MAAAEEGWKLDTEVKASGKIKIKATEDLIRANSSTSDERIAQERQSAEDDKGI